MLSQANQPLAAPRIPLGKNGGNSGISWMGEVETDAKAHSSRFDSDGCAQVWEGGGGGATLAPPIRSQAAAVAAVRRLTRAPAC